MDRVWLGRAGEITSIVIIGVFVYGDEQVFSHVIVERGIQSDGNPAIGSRNSESAFIHDVGWSHLHIVCVVGENGLLHIFHV